MTSILDIPNDTSLPDGGDPEWGQKWFRFLNDLGLSMVYEIKACWRSGYWIASVPSLNYEGVSHAIVMNHCTIEFDPSTAKAYPSGESLAGKGIVKGGHYLEVLDPSKLSKLIELQRSK